MEHALGPDVDGSFRRENCLRIWVGALRAFLGWTEARTLKWALKQWGEYVYSNDVSKRGSFFHDQPELYVAWLLIRERGVRFPPGPQGIVFARRLAFAMRDPTHRRRLGEFVERDRQESRKRISSILAEYGAALPVIDESNHGERDLRE